MERPLGEPCGDILARVSQLLCVFPISAAEVGARLQERRKRAPWLIRPFASAYQTCRLTVEGFRSGEIVHDQDDEARQLYQLATGTTSNEASAAMENVSRRLAQLAAAEARWNQLPVVSLELVRWAASGQPMPTWMEPAEKAYEALMAAAEAHPRRGRRYYARCELLRRDYRRAWEQALRQRPDALPQ